MPQVRVLTLAVLLLAVSMTPGCLLLAGAALGAGIVHVTSEDEAMVLLDADFEDALKTSREVLAEKGLLEARDDKAGLVEGSIGSSSVSIRVERGPDTGSKVTVESRKNGGVSPDVTTAQQVASAILARSP